MTDRFDFKSYAQGLGFRVALFAFIGMGWDVLMTLLQQIVAGRVDPNASCPASAWMYLAYGGVPLIIYPAASLFKRLGLFYPARLAGLLVVFYLVELGFGSTMRTLGITPWDYNWYLQPKWTFHGLITWHPAFIAAWLVFVALMEWLDAAVRDSYPAIKEKLLDFWKTV